MSRKNYGLTLACILLLAFLLRLHGIQFGLPDTFHADEPIIVNQAVAYGAGSWIPVYLKIPQLISYFLFGCYAIYFTVLLVFGKVAGAAEFGKLFILDPSSFYLLGRFVLGALTGTFSVYLLAVLIRKYFGQAQALLAALFFAVSFLHVRDSHYIYMDMPLIAILIAAFFPIFNIFESGRKRDYYLFGGLLGLAVATKYNGVFIVIPFLTAHFLRNNFRISTVFSPLLFAAAFCSIFTFMLVNPLCWLKPVMFFHDIFSMGGFEGYQGLAHHLSYSLASAVGIPMLAFAGLGLWRALSSRDPKCLIPLSFVFVYYLVLVLFSQMHDRYVLPLLPWICFFSSYGVLSLFEKKQIKREIIWMLVAVIAIPNIIKSCRSNFIFSAEDTRTQAKRWIESHVPENSKIAMAGSFFMPRLSPNLNQLRDKEIKAQASGAKANLKRVQWMIEDEMMRPGRIGYELFFLKQHPKIDGFLFALPQAPYDIQELISKQIRYVVISKTPVPENLDFYRQLRQHATQISRFSPYQDHAREEAYEFRPMTGGPSTWKELFSRNRNGHIVEIYFLDDPIQGKIKHL